MPACNSPHGHHSGCAHSHGGPLDERLELFFAILCGISLLVGWLISFAYEEMPPLSLACYLAAFFFGGFQAFAAALSSLRHWKFEIDFLMLVAAAGAAALGEWAEGALLLFLFSISHSLEHFAMGRARLAIEKLADLAPETALVRRDGATKNVSIDALKIGDTVIVKPNERIAADGFVSQGETSVDQSPITGESLPAEKKAVEDCDAAARGEQKIADEHRVFAGTINQSGSIEVQVTRLASESTLARVVKMVHEAEAQQSHTQRFAERFEAVFVPSVLVVVLLLLFAWTIVDEPFTDSFYRAMAVLVAASPCALAISTPSAVLSGVARAARGGVLFKGGAPLEILGTVTAIAFDKTGTLTEGRPQLTDYICGDSVSTRELLDTAIAIERLSDHPLAASIVRDGTLAKQDNGDASSASLAAERLQSITGLGVQAEILGEMAYIGKAELFERVGGPPVPHDVLAVDRQLKRDGRTTMILRRGDRYLGVIGVMDAPRETAKATVTRLRELGIRRMVMLSGDNQVVANAVANAVGVDEALGNLMPEEKVEAIKRLSTEGVVAMVGDGVNDAPALVHASVGIAMGAAGSDVALETADVALMADDLSQMPFAIGLSRMTSRIIAQNIWISLGMVAFLVPATIIGLRMGPAVALHEGSTLVVVLNALRLLGFRDS